MSRRYKQFKLKRHDRTETFVFRGFSARRARRVYPGPEGSKPRQHAEAEAARGLRRKPNPPPNVFEVH